jgi:hypothetical protein
MLVPGPLAARMVLTRAAVFGVEHGASCRDRIGQNQGLVKR